MEFHSPAFSFFLARSFLGTMGWIGGDCMAPLRYEIWEREVWTYWVLLALG